MDILKSVIKKEHVGFVDHPTGNLAHLSHPRLGGAWLQDKKTNGSKHDEKNIGLCNNKKSCSVLTIL